MRTSSRRLIVTTNIPVKGDWREEQGRTLEGEA